MKKKDFEDTLRPFRESLENLPRTTGEPGEARRLREAARRGDADYVISALTDPALRGDAASELGNMGDQRAVDALLRVLGANDAGLRAVVVQALGSIGDESALQPLQEVACADASSTVRGWAMDSLMRMKDRSSIPIMASALDDENLNVRRSAAAALAQFGDSRGVLALDALRRKERFVPRVLRATRATAPVDPLVAVAIAGSWLAATIGVALLTRSSWTIWFGEIGVAVFFREVWWRARERRARRLNMFAFQAEFEVSRSAKIRIYISAVVLVSLLFVLRNTTLPMLVSIFFLMIAVSRDHYERIAFRKGQPRNS